MAYQVVTLNKREMFLAATCGFQRHISALEQNLKPAHGFDGDPWGIHVEGACGEVCVAKVYNVYWDGSVNTFKKFGDLPGGIEVRTRGKHHYDLNVYPKDADDRPFVLVTGAAPTYRVHGWMYGKEAKEYPGAWQSYGGRPPAFFPPKSALRELSTLQDLTGIAVNC